MNELGNISMRSLTAREFNSPQLQKPIPNLYRGGFLVRVTAAQQGGNRAIFFIFDILKRSPMNS